MSDAHPLSIEPEDSRENHCFQLGWRRRWRSISARFRDELRYNHRASRMFAGLNHLRSLVQSDADRSLHSARQAYRYSPCHSALEAKARKQLQAATTDKPGCSWSERIADLRPFGDREDGPLTRTLVLKTPGENGERGVLLASFEYNWLRLLRNSSTWKKLSSRFDIILSTSSSPTSYMVLGVALEQTPDAPIYVMPCRYEEAAKLEAFHARVRCLPMLPCDWLDPSFYEPKPMQERSIGILMVAGWNPVKRHWHFFEALRSLPKTVRVVLVGQPEGGRDQEWVKSLAVAHGVRQDLDIRESISIEEVTKLQCDSRISVVFSRREGCCVAVTESFMADSPVGLIEHTSMGPASYINAETGRFLSLRHTGRDLRALFEEAETFAPRKWALSQITNRISAARLNQFFEKEAVRRNLPWTRDIMTPSWRNHPTLEFSDQTEEIQRCMLDLHRMFPELFPSDLFWQCRK